jgi:hypothetical protein
MHDLAPAAELLHAEETVVWADSGYQGIVNWPEMADKELWFRIALRAAKRRLLPATSEGRVPDLNVTAKARTAFVSVGSHLFEAKAPYMAI